MYFNMRNVSSYYGRTKILKEVSLNIEEGTCSCILGKNGVGKTTLVKTLMGLTTRSTGKIELSGKNLSELRTDQRAKLGMGYIPQGRQILGKFTVRENILLGTFAREDAVQDVPEICTRLFPYLKENLDRRAGLLSGGQQQQLAIARALAVNPKILILDEPTEGIQPNIVAEIGQTLKMLNKEMGITVVLTEQHIKVARQLGDTFVMLDNGSVVASGSINELTDSIIEKHLTV